VRLFLIQFLVLTILVLNNANIVDHHVTLLLLGHVGCLEQQIEDNEWLDDAMDSNLDQTAVDDSDEFDEFDEFDESDEFEGVCWVFCEDNLEDNSCFIIPHDDNSQPDPA
jgi:hypothetical protein